MFKPNRIDQKSRWAGQGRCPRPRWTARGPPNVVDEARAGENCFGDERCKRRLQERKEQSHESPMESSVRNAHRKR